MTQDNKYRVAIQYEEENGYIEYDSQNKTVHVELANAAKKEEVQNYLSNKQIISLENNTLMDFAPCDVIPTESLKSFQYALTRIWNATGILVAWSRPVE